MRVLRPCAAFGEWLIHYTDSSCGDRRRTGSFFSQPDMWKVYSLRRKEGEVDVDHPSLIVLLNWTIFQRDTDIPTSIASIA